MSQIQAAAPGAGGWTESRVTLLKALWGDGLTASEVARLMGGGLTRNAVIGKVHRLGLGGRSSNSARTPYQFGRHLDDQGVAGAKMQARARRTPQRRRRSTAPVKPKIPAALARLKAKPSEPRGLVDDLTKLGANQCKWPIGDPGSPDFSFCGTLAGSAYCDRHAALAHAPTTNAMKTSDRRLLKVLKAAER